LIYSGHMKDVISRIFPDLLLTLPINSINTWDLRKPRLGSLFPRKDETEHNLVNWSINKYKDAYLRIFFFLHNMHKIAFFKLFNILLNKSDLYAWFVFGSFLANIFSVRVQT